VTPNDDDVLAGLLRSAVNEIPVPDGGPGRVLAAERAGRAETHAPRGISAVRRLPLMAAVTVALVVGVIGAVTWESPSGPRTNVVGLRSAGSPATLGGHKLSGDGFTLGVAPPSDSADPGETTSAQSGNSSNPSSTSTALSARIESNGTIDLAVPRGDVAPVLSDLARVVTRDGGFVASTHFVAGRSGGEDATGVITLQVPVGSFARLVTQVEQAGHSSSVVTTATDVTGQYVDLQAQIGALEASRTQYLAIMTKATSISDILKVQSQLNSIESQIEVLQGQLYVLNNATTYGALAVSVRVAGAPTQAVSVRESGVTRAVKDSVGGFVTAFEGLIKVIGPALFVGLCLAALALVARSLRRVWRRRLI
jgi:hypothetical protein